MADQIVAGADYSGAKTQPNDTWLTVAKIGALGIEVLDVRKVGSHALAAAVQEHAAIKALGVDCPFSVPAEFASFLAAKRTKPDYQSWQELVQDVVFMSYEEFALAAKEFKKEPKRYADTQSCVAAQSPLHRANPSMIQMTFSGMRLLAMLDPARFYVQPFQKAIPLGCAVIEVFPRATLHTFALTETGYKSQEKSEQDRVQTTRSNMLAGLTSIRERKGVSFQDYPRLTVPKRFEKTFVESDHALDSLIACYTTAAYVATPDLFCDPFASDNLDVLLEGWIYELNAPAK